MKILQCGNKNLDFCVKKLVALLPIYLGKNNSSTHAVCSQTDIVDYVSVFGKLLSCRKFPNIITYSAV